METKQNMVLKKNFEEAASTWIFGYHDGNIHGSWSTFVDVRRCAVSHLAFTTMCENNGHVLE